MAHCNMYAEAMFCPGLKGALWETASNRFVLFSLRKNFLKAGFGSLCFAYKCKRKWTLNIYLTEKAVSLYTSVLVFSKCLELYRL